MLVPQYWAEARVQQKVGGRQRTMRRFGWSDVSQQQAQQLADERAQAAMSRLQAGDTLPWREPKVPYNGAEGVPIREEVISRHGAVVITRNAYGALCLNTGNVLFADLDFETGVSARLWLVVFCCWFVAALVAATGWQAWGTAFLLVFAGVLLSYPLALLVLRIMSALSGGAEQRARARIHAFSKANPDWHLRVYRTPAGMRVLALQRTFNPLEADVARCFAALHADPLYRKMCLNQQCFRARVSPKPWRIGVNRHLRPRPGVWPVAPEQLPARQEWVDHYNRLATGFAACRFVERLGSDVSDPEALAVQRLHDELCRAQAELPLA